MKSRRAADGKAPISERLSVSVGLIVLGLVSQPFLPSTHVLKSANSSATGLNQGSERTPNAGNGIIAGVVVNGRQEPVVRVQVPAQAYAATPIQIELVRVQGARLAGSTPTIDKALSSGALVEQFKSEKVFWLQFTIAKEIVDRHDASILASLVAGLSHVDRHERGNVAFVFGGLGDPRGFQVITDILTDHSDRPRGVVAGGNWTLRAQIREDRYYAAHLLGDLRDPRAIPILVPLLNDTEVNSIVPWALGQIGNRAAIGPLLDVLDDDSPSMRVLAIDALETLNAREALPRLISLRDDHRKSNFGAQVSVAEAATAAIAKLQ